jgi:hypothetical protein
MARGLTKVIDLTLQLTSHKAGVCSGLTPSIPSGQASSSVFLICLQRQDVAPLNGSHHPVLYVSLQSIGFDRFQGPLRKGSYHTHVVLSCLPAVGSYRLSESGVQH